MRQELPLTDEEVAAVDERMATFERLPSRLADVPTPTGPTPREMRQREANVARATGGDG